MAYVRLDDSVMDNPKMLALSDRAFRGWVWGLCYAQRHLTDGFLPLAALTGPVKRAAGELQSRGLWTVADHGFQIHDYLKHQDSKEVVESRKVNGRARVHHRRVSLDRLLAFWGAACVYCGAEGRLQIEHIVPLARGGTNDLTNLTVACKTCNLEKRTKTAEEFGYPHIHQMALGIQ